MEIIKRNTDYAIRALLAIYNQAENKSVKTIAMECDISEIFLHKIFQKLSKSGIVQSTRGSEGGFSFKKDPKKVTILEILEIVQGKFAINKCFLGKNYCPREKNCKVKNKLTDVQHTMLNYLSDITLDKFMDEGVG